MLNNLKKEDWLKLLPALEDKIPSTLILRGTRNLREKFDNHKKYFTNVRELVFPNGIFENVFIGELNGNLTAFATVYGAPMASEIVHLFGVLGTSLVIHTGCCGGLEKKLKTGDIFIANEAYIGEGASQHYKLNKTIVESSIKDMMSFDDVKKGRIYTTSALLAESKEDIEKWSDLGCMTVDMETSAVFITAEYFNMESTSVLFVYDNPLNKDHLFIENQTKTELYRTGQDKVLEITWAIVKNHNMKLKNSIEAIYSA